MAQVSFSAFVSSLLVVISEFKGNSWMVESTLSCCILRNAFNLVQDNVTKVLVYI